MPTFVSDSAGLREDFCFQMFLVGASATTGNARQGLVKAANTTVALVIFLKQTGLP
jgi:hypothetical protein